MSIDPLDYAAGNIIYRNTTGGIQGLMQKINEIIAEVNSMLAGSEWLETTPASGVDILTGVLRMIASSPYLRLDGDETSGKDVRIYENAGSLYLQDNTGTAEAPTWTTRISYDMATGNVTLIGPAHKQKGDTPYLRLTGTETSAVDWRLAESAGNVLLQKNTGTEDTPIWSTIVTVSPTIGLAATLTADAAGRAHMADLFITNAKVNDVAGSKLTGTGFISAGMIATNGVSAAGQITDGIITGAKQSTTIVSNSNSGAKGVNTYWTPSAGFYNFYVVTTATTLVFQMYLNGGWKDTKTLATGDFFSMWCDGNNVRFYTGSSAGTTTIYYMTR